jgi:hypothetical protein
MSITSKISRKIPFSKKKFKKSVNGSPTFALQNGSIAKPS